MPTCYGLLSNAMGQGQSHLVPNPSIHPKQSKQSTATSIVSQKTLVVKSKKSARTDVSGRQSGSKDFSSTSLTKKKLQGGVQGVLVKKAAKGVETVSVKRKLVLRDETDSEDDLPISSIMNVNKEVADTATAAVDTDGQDTSIPDERSNPDAQANPDVGIPDAAPSQVVPISDSPAKDSPTKRHFDILWEKYGAATSNLGIKHPMEKLRKAEELVFSRQKKLKGSSLQEPGPQSGSAATTDDPATQEPLNQSLGEGLAIGMVTQEPFSQWENEDISIPATQEPSSQCEDAGKATVSEKFPDKAQGISGADEVTSLVKETVTEGSTQEPLTQSVEAASEPQAPQEPLVANTDASPSNPDSVVPDASGAHDAEPILIQPLSSRPMIDPITASQDKLKGIAIPDPDVTFHSNADDSDDSDDDNQVEKDQLARVIKSSLGTNFGSSSTFMTGKASTGKDLRQDFSVPFENPAEALRNHEWNNSWYKSSDSVSYPYALDHAYDAVKLIENQDLKNHLKATTLLSKSLKNEIDSVKATTDLVRNGISNNFTKVHTALQLRIVESKVNSIIADQSSINNRIDSLDSKGEKVSQTKCTPDLVLRNNDDDDHTGNDGGDKVLQGETSDAAVMKSTIQTSQSQTTQSTHVSDSGIRTVRTLVQSQILTEEQILTGDQFLMNDQILTPGHGQTLSTIPEGNEDVLIDNPEDASNLFQKFTTRDGNVITLYHTDKRVQQLFARKALSTASEEYPDLSQEEFLIQQREMMESFNNPAPARGRGGRGRRGARRGRRSSSTPTMPRQTRSRILRIEEIPETSKNPIDPVVRDIIEKEDKEVSEEEPELRRRPKQSTLINNTVQISDSNPDIAQDPDDSEILQEVDLLILSTVVDSHNKCDTPINFRSGGIITSVSSVVDLSDIVESKALWLRILSNLKQLTNNSRGGIGHRDAEYLNMPYLDPYSLTEIGGTLTSEHLNNLLVVDIVIDCHDGFEKKEKLLYFMKDGSVKILSIQDLLVKTTKELKYVHYLLKWKNEVCKVCSDMILSTIRRRFLEGRNFNGNYTPMYLNLRGQDVEMQRGTAVKEVTFGMTRLTLNPDGKEIAYLLLEEQSLQRSSIQNLRAAIYQINEEDEELRNLKERLIQILEEKEENLLSNFLRMNLFYQRI
ncbi:hypothetical protein POM88_038503 [Heracleum sosnowskyi]|uniref:Uncharacterized protein n=1 Tax=Heracleum sosnowskyi TaxID=360622 RepID=A0AAD8M7Z5_9APIA|nr:hypothetical protein POM88_038503 [Heracleum sosnowskyi]